MASLIRAAVISLQAVEVDQATGVDPSAVGLTRADLGRVLVKVVKELRVRIGIKPRKCIMGSRLLYLLTLKTLEMALNAAHQKGANHLIKGLESLEIQAKASDFDEFSPKSAIILDLQ